MRAGLFWTILTLEARKRMSYRADFWINSIVGLLVTLSFFWFLTRAMFASGRPTLAGFTPSGMMLYYVFVSLLGRLAQSNEIELGISQDIYDGSLSKYLLYPAPYGGVKYAQQWGTLAPQVIQMVLLGTLAPILIGIPDEIRFTWASTGMALISMIAANALHFLITRPIQAIAFWADNVWSLLVAERIAMSMLGGQLLPLELLPEWARSLLYQLPFPYLYAFPAMTLMGKVSSREWLVGLGITALWCGAAALVGRWIWRRGDLQYSGVGI
jgi:ABC-2 type transport system permease protein